jgi:PST family polysaccharide transporter
LKSTSITGGATIINILISIIRTKIVAILLGPAGIGIIGLFQSFVSTATAFSGLGIATAASREIAQENGRENAHALAHTRQTLFFATILLGVIGGAIIWLLREEFASRVIGNIAESNNVGWLALAVSLSVISASQMAIIQGMRQITELAKLNVLSGLVSAVGGILIIWKFGDQGLAAFIIVAPASSVLLGIYFAKRSSNLVQVDFRISKVFSKFGLMAKLGSALFIYALLEQVTFLLIRANIGNTLGAVELGNFQAGWTVAVMYLGVITGAMSSDFMPRIAGKTGDNESINKLINQQTEIGILIATPVIVLMMGYAPFIISLMYSKDFTGSVELMRLLLLSDVLKLISWPIGIAILGMGDGAAFARQGPIQLILLFVGIYLMLPFMGLLSVGLTMLMTQSVGFIWGYRYIFLKTGYQLEKKLKKLVVVSALVVIATYFICSSSEVLGAIIATLFAISITIFSYKDIKLKLLNNG